MKGQDYKGLIFGLFTLTALISRPLSGKLTELIGRKPVIMLGISIGFVCSLLYPILAFVWGFLLLRLVHGFSTGFTPTGTTTYVSDIVPANRRGEAVGIMGFMGNLGMSLSPFMGVEIVRYSSTEVLFYVAALVALSSIALFWNLPETKQNTSPFRLQMLRLHSKDLIERRVFAPTLVMFLTLYSYGAILTLMPDLSKHLGVANKGTFFSIYALSSLVMRVTAGKASDIYGRVFIIRWGILALGFGLWYLAYAKSAVDIYISAIVFGLGVGITSPTIFAWAIDLSNPQERGKAISTLFMGLEAGIFVGAITSGWLFGNDLRNATLVFLISFFLTILSWIYLQFIYKEVAQKP